MTSRPIRTHRGRWALACALLASNLFVHVPAASPAATIVIVNMDGAGEGFNDPTARAPVGGNPGTTLGAQRLNVFQAAANIWGSLLTSPITIRVQARLDPQFCTATSAVLGSAGPTAIDSDFPGAAMPGTWYVSALVNKMAGSDLNPGNDDIGATFNSDVDNPTCLGTRSWYYGLDGNEGTDIEMLPVLLHEIGHGLGFLTLVDGSDGTQMFGQPDIYERFMLDITTGKHWPQMTDAERLASATNNGHLVWDGPAVTFKAPFTLGPRAKLVVNAPGAIAGNMAMGRASFGADLATPGLTRAVVLANDGVGTASDACTALTNAAAVSGKIALVDRSADCTDLVKAQNVQAAGAAGMLLVDNVASTTPPTMRGTDNTLTLTVGGLRQVDGNAIRAQLGAGVNVTMTVDPTKRSGADDNHHPMLYAPNPQQPGSSLSHWDVEAFPNLLMEPALNTSVHNTVDLTREAFEDIGWFPHTTAVDANPPLALRLPVNSPNPFVSSTTIRFALERSGNADLSIFDVSGRLVRHLAQGWMTAGDHELQWDGSDAQGRSVSPGVYLYRLSAGSSVGARHMVMVR